MVEGIVAAPSNPGIVMSAYLTDKALNFTLNALSSGCRGLALCPPNNKVIRRTKKQR